jgi:hypothetical protein
VAPVAGSGPAARVQRTRWEGGRARIVRRYLGADTAQHRIGNERPHRDQRSSKQQQAAHHADGLTAGAGTRPEVCQVNSAYGSYPRDVRPPCSDPALERAPQELQTFPG